MRAMKMSGGTVLCALVLAAAAKVIADLWLWTAMARRSA